MKIAIWIILIGLIVLGVWLYFKFFKIPKIKNLVFIDGTLGSGKSYLSVALAVKLHKRALRRWRLKKLFAPLIIFVNKIKNKDYKWEEPEKPLLYSNIPLRNYPFVKVTKELLMREHRFTYKSVLLLDEISLMADQYTYKDRDVSEKLSNFFKLFRHETKGGYCVINSQSTSDLHYSVKYVLSDYLYIHHNRKFPFLSALQVQEMAYCGDKDGASIVNVRNEDIERTNRLMLCGNRYYKMYDTYAYSVFTDGAYIVQNPIFIKKTDEPLKLKCADLVSFKDYRFLKIARSDEK